jgi:tetratricopeptide (TPR) repeat protein
MFQRDYLMRMLTQFTAVVAQLMGLKKEMKHDQVFVVINETLEKYFRLNSKLIQSLSDSDLLTMFKSGEILDNDKAITVAYLLKTEGESYEALGSTDESCKRYLTALTLFTAAVENDAHLGYINFHVEIDDLLDRLRTYELPVDSKLALFDYFIKVERFDAAENVLFELAAPPTNLDPLAAEDLSRKGIQFYNQLLQKDDPQLLAGGLPRLEVEEGLTQFKQLVLTAG